jgi:hypothetical protein
MKNLIIIICILSLCSCKKVQENRTTISKKVGSKKELPSDSSISKSKVSKTAIKNDFKTCSLPFDFDKYYSLCYENGAACNQRYPSYLYPENKKILESFGIDEQPSTFFILPKINDFQVIILAFTDSDVEGYYLKVIDKNKIISSLQIAKMDGETIEDFLITENYDIELYTRRNATEKRLLKKKYKIENNGLLKYIQ